MFTAILEGISDQVNSDGTYSFFIVYTDKASFKYQRTYTARVPNDAAIQQAASKEIATLNAAYADVGAKTLRPGDEIPINNAPTPAPSAASVEFFAKFRQMVNLERAVAIGLVDDTAGAVDALRAELKKLWLDEYLGLV